MPTTAGEVLANYLAQQLAELRHQEPLVRQEEPDSVHQMRMCARRLRSVLATGKKLFDDAAVTELRAELRWLSEVLGSARDPEVIHDRLRDLLAKEPDALIFGPAAQRIDNELDTTSAAGRRAVMEALDGDRYASLVARLEELVAAPPLTAKAAGGARKTMRKLVSRDTKRVRRKVRELEEQRDGGGGEESRENGQTRPQTAADPWPSPGQRGGPEPPRRSWRPGVPQRGERLYVRTAPRAGGSSCGPERGQIQEGLEEVSAQLIRGTSAGN